MHSPAEPLHLVNPNNAGAACAMADAALLVSFVVSSKGESLL
jgi:hypothetical protein